MDAPNAPAVPPPRRPGWLRRNWLWFVPALLVGLFVACAGCGLGIAWVVIGRMKSAEPYRMALALVRQDAQVKAALGEPVEEATWWRPPGGFAHEENAVYAFDVKGPRGIAHVRTEAAKIDGDWVLKTLDVTVEETGERIGVDTSATSQSDEAPPWKPARD